MTRAIVVYISGDNEPVLHEYAEALADMIDEAMESHEKTKQIPEGVKWDGVSVLDPDKPDEPEEPAEVVKLEVVDGGNTQ